MIDGRDEEAVKKDLAWELGDIAERRRHETFNDPNRRDDDGRSDVKRLSITAEIVERLETEKWRKDPSGALSLVVSKAIDLLPGNPDDPDDVVPASSITYRRAAEILFGFVEVQPKDGSDRRAVYKDYVAAVKIEADFDGKNFTRDFSRVVRVELAATMLKMWDASLTRTEEEESSDKIAGASTTDHRSIPVKRHYLTYEEFSANPQLSPPVHDLIDKAEAAYGYGDWYGSYRFYVDAHQILKAAPQDKEILLRVLSGRYKAALFAGSHSLRDDMGIPSLFDLNSEMEMELGFGFRSLPSDPLLMARLLHARMRHRLHPLRNNQEQLEGFNEIWEHVLHCYAQSGARQEHDEASFEFACFYALTDRQQSTQMMATLAKRTEDEAVRWRCHLTSVKLLLMNEANPVPDVNKVFALADHFFSHGYHFWAAESFAFAWVMGSMVQVPAYRMDAALESAMQGFRAIRREGRLSDLQTIPWRRHKEPMQVTSALLGY